MDVQNICCTFTLIDTHCTTPLVETRPGRRSQAICIDHGETVKIPALTHDAIVLLNHHVMTITVLATRRFAPPPKRDVSRVCSRKHPTRFYYRPIWWRIANGKPVRDVGGTSKTVRRTNESVRKG